MSAPDPETLLDYSQTLEQIKGALADHLQKQERRSAARREQIQALEIPQDSGRGIDACAAMLHGIATEQRADFLRELIFCIKRAGSQGIARGLYLQIRIDLERGL